MTAESERACLGKLPKKELAALAEREVAETGWLPEMMGKPDEQPLAQR